MKQKKSSYLPRYAWSTVCDTCLVALANMPPKSRNRVFNAYLSWFGGAEPQRLASPNEDGVFTRMRDSQGAYCSYKDSTLAVQRLEGEEFYNERNRGNKMAYKPETLAEILRKPEEFVHHVMYSLFEWYLCGHIHAELTPDERAFADRFIAEHLRIMNDNPDYAAAARDQEENELERRMAQALQEESRRQHEQYDAEEDVEAVPPDEQVVYDEDNRGNKLTFDNEIIAELLQMSKEFYCHVMSGFMKWHLTGEIGPEVTADERAFVKRLIDSHLRFMNENPEYAAMERPTDDGDQSEVGMLEI